MLLAWRSKEIRDVCASSDGLDRAWPEHADAARLLLGAVCSAPELLSLRSLMSLELKPAATPGNATLSIRMGEVEMTAAVIHDDGRHVRLTATEDFWERTGGATSLEVIVLAAGKVDLGAAVAA